MTIIYRVLLLCLAAAVWTGCNREDSGPAEALPPVTAPASPRAPQARSDQSVPPSSIPESNDANATLQQLTQALRDYVVRTRTVPKNFEEFAGKSKVSFPPAPEGKKYEIRGQEVVLEKR